MSAEQPTCSRRRGVKIDGAPQRSRRRQPGGLQQMGDSKSIDVLIRVVVDDPPGGVAFQLQRGTQELVPALRATPKAIGFEFGVRIKTRPTGEPNFLGPFAQSSPASRDDRKHEGHAEAAEEPLSAPSRCFDTDTDSR
jgi:hypothetical protein